MKKVLAVLLAAAMATTMAFAAAEINIGYVTDSGNLGGADQDQLLPGETYNIPLYTSVSLDNWDTTDEDKNIKSVSVKWNEGGALVESLKLKDKSTLDASLELNLKENYTISTDDIRSLKGTVTVKYTGKDTPDDEFIITGDVGNDYVLVTTERRADDAETVEVLNNTVYEADGTGYLKIESGDGLLNGTLRMKDGAKAFLYMEEDADALDTIYDNYDDVVDEAYVHTYDFIAHPSVADATLTLQAGYKDQYYIYELNGTKLDEVKTTWNRADGQYEWDTNTLATYVISEVELVAADEPADEENNTTDTTVEENPSTGANDFVGLAVALAVVSVAGIAVAKRK